MHDVHCSVTGFYQQIENGNIANQIHGFTIDYGKFILINNIKFNGIIVFYMTMSMFFNSIKEGTYVFFFIIKFVRSSLVSLLTYILIN